MAKVLIEVMQRQVQFEQFEQFPPHLQPHFEVT
jgi:hypothetical protein